MERITTPELAQKFIDEQISELRAQIGDKKVLLALSGVLTLPWWLPCLSRLSANSWYLFM